MSDEEVSDFEEEISEEKHAQLVENVINLDDKQYIKKPTRSEPTTEISEFNLVNSLTGKDGSIHINELTKVLKNQTKYSDVGKLVRRFQKKAKTLDKPLEKPYEDRLKRSVGYEKVKKELSRWDPIVFYNRSANNLSFPLVKDLNLDVGKNFTSHFRLKSDLQKELEKIEPKIVTDSVEENERFPLTMEEIMEKRKEAAKLRAIQSYKAAKAKRQNKIKSKSYHRIQRRERIRKQLKEFEELQKTNPEEALKKLEEIEKARAEERLTLRHKSTGKWARNKQIRAKYDKESRQALVQQLQISRDLTQKLKANNSSDSEENDETVENKKLPSNDTENNPWINNNIRASKDVADFITGYRKFWEERNKQLQSSKVEEKKPNITENAGAKTVLNRKDNQSPKICNNNDYIKEIESLKTEDTQNDMNKASVKNNTKDSVREVADKTKKRKIDKEVVKARDLSGNSKKRKNMQNTATKATDKQNSSLSTTEWEISALDTDTLIDNMSYIIEAKLKKNLEEKVNELKKELKLDKGNNNKNSKKKKMSKKSKMKADLSLPSQTKNPIVDEELKEDTTKKSHQDILKDNFSEIVENNENSERDSLKALETILSVKEKEKPKNSSNNDDIDPNKFMTTKTVHLNTDIPQLLSYDDNPEDESQKDIIAEAFEDDDVIEEFKQDKKAEIDKDKPKDIDLTLPGWGSWGGTGIKVSKRKKRRFIIKFPKHGPRKDKNKGNLIIKENNKPIKPHLVSELPFPFKTVKDFEASIRAPLGNTFVPESAFRRNIKPAVMTKLGSIIDPIDEDVLLKKKKK